MDIETLQTNRLLTMKAIYEASHGSENIPVSGPELLEQLGLQDQELGDACNYLKGEYLIRTTKTMWSRHTPYIIYITHRGIREMEESLQAPTQPTEHFPPAVSVINIQGSVIGSAIQSGSPGAQQEVHTEMNLGSIRDFLRKLEETVPTLDLPMAQRQELGAEIATLRAQVDSPKPKKQIIRESLHSIRTVVEGAGGNMTAVALLDLLQHIHF